MLFISPQNLLSFSRHLSYCLDILFQYKNDLIRNIRLISKFMTSQPGQQAIEIHILPNISRSKVNQTMKFGRLTECNMRSNFLEKSCIKYGEETIPMSFSKKSKLSISLDHYFKVLCSLFLICNVCQVEGYQNILKISCRPLILTSHKAFLKNKKRSRASFPASFSA